jgi:hypothetical protein
MMISRALELKVPLFATCSQDRELKKYILSEEEWQVLESIMGILKVFERSCNSIGADHGPVVRCSIRLLNGQDFFFFSMYKVRIKRVYFKPHVEGLLGSPRDVVKFYSYNYRYRGEQV